MLLATATSVSAAFRTEVAVIGAGVVGLAIARSLARSGKEVLSWTVRFPYAQVGRIRRLIVNDQRVQKT